MNLPDQAPPAPQPLSRLVRTSFGPMIVPTYDTVVSRCLLLYGEWAFAEMALLGPLIQAGDVVVDCGAHIGAHSLFFARQVGRQGQVFCFEPQRLLFQHLCGNVAVNGLSNVTTFWAALGDTAGALRPPEIDPLRPENLGGRAMDGVGDPRAMQVPVMTVDSLTLSRCRLIKIDAEGMERVVIQGATKTIRQHRPLLYVENNKHERSATLIETISALGYRLFWHFSPYFRPGNFNKKTENVFPNTADPNMLCLPAEVEAAVDELDPVRGPQDDWRQARQRAIERVRALKKA
jgi:FkbM family methyltransferase